LPGRGKEATIYAMQTPPLRFALAFLFLILSSPPLAQAQEFQSDWLELKGTHFIVYYGGEKPDAAKIMRSAEHYYKKIAKNLGYERLHNFWLFDGRCRIYVYPSRELFHQFQPQAPAWSGGFAEYEEKKIIGFIDGPDFVKTALPHEIAHLILRDYLDSRGTSGNVPMWLDEGVALSQETLRRPALEEMVWKSFQNRTFIPIDKLTNMRVALAKHHSEVELYYAQAALLIDFLMKRSRKNEFVEFCRALRDGLEVDQALSRGYNGRLKSVEQLEGAFLRDLSGQFK